MILQVKRRKTCKIGQSRIKSGQLVKNMKTGPISRFLLKWKTVAVFCFTLSPVHVSSLHPSPFLLYPFPLSLSPLSKSPAAKQIKKSDWEIGSTLHSPLTSNASESNCLHSPLTRTFLARRSTTRNSLNTNEITDGNYRRNNSVGNLRSPLLTEFNPSVISSVYTDDQIPSVYTNGITDRMLRIKKKGGSLTWM
jgi:hypothetical protein